MPDEQTPTPHLEKLFREVAEDEFWAIRGKTTPTHPLIAEAGNTPS